MLLVGYFHLRVVVVPCLRWARCPIRVDWDRWTRELDPFDLVYSLFLPLRVSTIPGALAKVRKDRWRLDLLHWRIVERNRYEVGVGAYHRASDDGELDRSCCSMIPVAFRHVDPVVEVADVVAVDVVVAGYVDDDHWHGSCR